MNTEDLENVRAINAHLKNNDLIDEIELYMDWGKLPPWAKAKATMGFGSRITLPIHTDLNIRSANAEVIVSECEKLLDKFGTDRFPGISELSELREFTKKFTDKSPVNKSKLEEVVAMIDQIHQNFGERLGSQEFRDLIIDIMVKLGATYSFIEAERRAKQETDIEGIEETIKKKRLVDEGVTRDSVLPLLLGHRFSQNLAKFQDEEMLTPDLSALDLELQGTVAADLKEPKVSHLGGYRKRRSKKKKYTKKYRKKSRRRSSKKKSKKKYPKKSKKRSKRK